MTVSIKEMTEVMQAYDVGAKVQWQWNDEDPLIWNDTDSPSFNWQAMNYRVAPAVPDTIPWDSIHDDFQWAARTPSGAFLLFENKPELINDGWKAVAWRSPRIDRLMKVKNGGQPWTQSLQERPAKMGSRMTIGRNGITIEDVPAGQGGVKFEDFVVPSFALTPEDADGLSLTKPTAVPLDNGDEEVAETAVDRLVATASDVFIPDNAGPESRQFIYDTGSLKRVEADMNQVRSDRIAKPWEVKI